MQKSNFFHFIFYNINFFHFSWHIIWLVCRMVTIFFYWLKDIRQASLPDTLNVSIKNTENFLRWFEEKNLIKHEQEIELEVSLENSDKTSCFELRLFLKCHQKIFCWLYEHIQCILEVRSTLIFASVKNSWLYDMSIGLYCEFSYLSFLRQHRITFVKNKMK